MSSLRSIIFYIFISLWGMLIPLFYSSVFITNNAKKADQGAKNWAKFVIWVLKTFYNIKYEVRGLENIPKNSGCIIACKHQSMWDTVVMHLIFHRPAYAYKKELLKIPFYGWFLKRMSGITIDRKGGARALKSLLSQSKKYLNNNQAIIIFPQGTRTPIGSNTQDYPYQSGITALYSLKAPVVPVALNSGVNWNKKGKLKEGTIILELLPAIDPNLNKKEFLPLLEKVIENKSNELVREAE